MRSPHRGAPPIRPPAGRGGRTAARTLTAAAAMLLALTGALTATAKDTQISLEVTGDELVLVGGTHTLDITATKTADDPSNPIGCVEIAAPTGWTGLTIVAGTQPASGWSADDGPPATWSADTGGGKLQYLGEAAEVEVSATAPGTPGTGTWTVTLYDSVTCADTPIMSAEFEVDVVTSLADLDVVPASATVTTGATHDVAFTASWIASDGDAIGCIAVTLPAGWSGIGTTGMGSPVDWSSSTMGQVVVWRADTVGDVIDATGESASFTVTATAPGTAGESDWTAAVFAAIDCSGDPILTGTAEVTLEAPPVDPDPDLDITPASATVTTGATHDVAFTASWIASDGDAIGCIAVTLPTGWTGIGTTGMGAPLGWSSSLTGQVITWAADTVGDVIDATGESATFTVTATAPDTAGDSDWTAAVHAAIDCSGEPLLTGTADVTLVAPVTPEADLEMTPAAATITVGTTHDVDVVATWVAGDGDGIGCVVVTLPDGWTSPGLTVGLPVGWSATVDATELTVTWSADTAEDRLLLPGDAASFTVTATAPGTAGSGTFDGEAFENLDCTGEPFVSDAALVTWVAAPTGGGGDGGDDTPAVLPTDPEVLATDPPVPGAIPAGEGPAPRGPRTAAALLAALAAAAGGLAGAIRRRGTEARWSADQLR